MWGPILLALLLVAIQAALTWWRPKGWGALVGGLCSVQIITVCLVSVAIVPVLINGSVVLWEAVADARAPGSGNLSNPQNTQGTSLLPFRAGEVGRISTNYLHGPIHNWRGIDYARACGMDLVAPIEMRVVGVGQNDGAGNTSIKLAGVTDTSVELGLVHGSYHVVAGQHLAPGEVFGTTQSRGNSTGCHDHVVLWIDGVLRDISRYKSPGRLAGGKASKPLIMSEYHPEEGGINCDSDCSVVANGTSTWQWRDRGAACIREWTARGQKIMIDGRVWECVDTGGDIVETDTGYWVDLYTYNSGYAYGSLNYNWHFVD